MLKVEVQTCPWKHIRTLLISPFVVDLQVADSRFKKSHFPEMIQFRLYTKPQGFTY